MCTSDLTLPPVKVQVMQISRLHRTQQDNLNLCGLFRVTFFMMLNSKILFILLEEHDTTPMTDIFVSLSTQFCATNPEFHSVLSQIHPTKVHRLG